MDENISSGAEKVERIAAEEAERRHADERVEAAKARERAALEAAEGQEAKQRQKAQEKKQNLAERAVRREEREEERMQKMQAREEKREKRRKERKQRGSGGVGGWIAAVVSLGVACLTLAAVVTAGSYRMQELEGRMESAAQELVYEMAEASEGMDASLAKLRVSEGRSEQRRLLTELAVNCALFESALEKLPLNESESRELSSFINRTGAYAKLLLERLNAGGTLQEREAATLDYLHAVNLQLLNALGEAEHHLSHEELAAFFKGEHEGMHAAFEEMAAFTKTEGEGLVEPPFAGAGNVHENRLSGGDLTEKEAVERAKQYLSGYHIQEALCTGEARLGDAVLFSIALSDGETQYDCAIAKKDGSLVYFSAAAACGEQNFDLEACKALALNFLKDIGIKNVEAVWASEAGGTAELAFVPVQENVRLYSDLVRVRVCESEGRVVGVDAVQYRLNHRERTLKSAKSAEAIGAYLSPRLTVEAAHLALIPFGREERLAYEFSCTFGEEQFIAFLDAVSGEELALFEVLSGEGGSFFR